MYLCVCVCVCVYMYSKYICKVHELAQRRYPMVDEGFLRVRSFQHAKLLNLGYIQIWLHFIMTSNLGWNANWLFVCY